MSLDMIQIEQRLSSLEAGLSQVQQKLGLAPSGGNWVEDVSGSLADIPEEDYQRFLDCCRAVRMGGSTEEPQP
jgi:hypothetical protein